MVEPGPVPQPAPKPDDQRAELERLRKMKRLQELEAKAKAPAAPQVSNPANGAGLGPVNPMVEMGLNAQREALLSQKQNYDQNMRTLAAANNAGVNIPGNPAELAAKAAAEPFAPRDPSIRLRPDPFGQTPFNKDEAIGALDAQERARQAKKDRREASAAYGAGSDFIQTTDEGGNVVPGSPSDTYVGKTIVGAPIQLGQGLAEGVANLWNNATGMADDFVNTGNKLLLGDRAVKFDTPKIEVPANALVDQGGPLATELGVVPRIAGQFMAGRVPLGKAAPGGGVGAEVAKDALSFAATTDKETPRISDMIPSGTPGIGFMADMLRTQPGENTATAFAKNVIEDATISTAAIGFLKLAGKGLDVATGGGKATGATPPAGTLTPVSGLSDAERKAIDLIIRKLDADGVTIEDVKRVAASLGRRGDSGVYETLAEVVSLSGKSSGANTRGLAMAGGAVPGPTQQALVARVNENTAKLPDRLSRAATRATGQDASNAVATLDDLNARLKTEAGPLYEDFYNAPVDQRVYDAEIAPVLNAPHGQAAMERAARGLGVEAASLQARVASGGASPKAQAALQRTYDAAEALRANIEYPQKLAQARKAAQQGDAAAMSELAALEANRPPTIPPMALDHVKRAFDDLIDEAGQATYTGGNLRAAKRNFAESVSNATGGAYGNALGTYEGIKRLEDAFETGLKALTQKTWQLERDLAKGRGGAPYSGGEIEALAMGVARHIEDLIEANDQAALTKLLKGKALQNMAMALGNEKAAKMFEQSIRRLAGNREFGRRVAGGSDTAMRQAAIRDAGVEAEDAVTKGLDAVERGNVPLNLQSVVDASLRGGARKAKEIYRQFRYPGLYDEDVNAALAPLISQPMTETRVNDLASKIATRNAQRGRVRGGVGNALLPGQAKARLAAPTAAPSPPRRRGPPKPNDAGFAGLTPLGAMVGGAGGYLGAQDINGDGTVDAGERAAFTVGGIVGGTAAGYGVGRALTRSRPAGNALKSGPAKAPPAMAEAPKAPPAGPASTAAADLARAKNVNSSNLAFDDARDLKMVLEGTDDQRVHMNALGIDLSLSILGTERGRAMIKRTRDAVLKIANSKIREVSKHISHRSTVRHLNDQGRFSDEQIAEAIGLDPAEYGDNLAGLIDHLDGRADIKARREMMRGAKPFGPPSSTVKPFGGAPQKAPPASPSTVKPPGDEVTVYRTDVSRDAFQPQKVAEYETPVISMAEQKGGAHHRDLRPGQGQTYTLKIDRNKFFDVDQSFRKQYQTPEWTSILQRLGVSPSRAGYNWADAAYDIQKRDGVSFKEAGAKIEQAIRDEGFQGFVAYRPEHGNVYSAFDDANIARPAPQAPASPPVKPPASAPKLSSDEWHVEPLSKTDEYTAPAIARPLYHKTAAQFDSFNGPTFFSTDPNVNLARHNTIDAQSGRIKDGVVTIQAVARKGLKRIPAPEYRKLINSGELDSQFPREITPEQASRLSKMGYDYAVAGTEVVIFDPKNVRRIDAPASPTVKPSGAPKKPPVQNGFGGSKLPMDEASRMQRAREWGGGADVVSRAQAPKYKFQTGKPVTVEGLHGTRGRDIKEFDLDEAGSNFSQDEGTLHFSDNADDANSYATSDTVGMPANDGAVYPVYIRMQNPLVADAEFFRREGMGDVFKNEDRISAWDTYHPFLKERAQELGADGIILKDSFDRSHYVSFDPKNVRGKFATFDPAQSSSSKLLAGFGNKATYASAGTGIAYGELGPLEDLNRDGVKDEKDRQAMRIKYGMGGIMTPLLVRGGVGMAKSAGRRVAGKAPPVGNALKPPAQSGFGGGKGPPAPANKLKAPPKPRGEGPGIVSRMVSGGVIGGIAGSAGSADPQEVTAFNEFLAPLADERKRISGLEKELNIILNGTVEEKQAYLAQSRGLKISATGEPDGKLGPDTRAAIAKARTELEAAIREAQAREKDIGGKAEKRRAEIEMKAAFDRTRSNGVTEFARELGPWVGIGAGVLAGTLMRRGAVQKTAAQSAAKASSLNRLLSDATPTTSDIMVGRKAMGKRATNLNEFWYQGGAGKPDSLKQRFGGAPKKGVPFMLDENGDWMGRPSAKDAFDLFKPGTKHFKMMDVAVIGAAMAESEFAGNLAKGFHQEAVEAQAAVDKAQEEGNAANLEIAMARLESAKNAEAAAIAFQRFGQVAALARTAGAFKMPYEYTRPNVKKAQADQALILDAINRSRNIP